MSKLAFGCSHTYGIGVERNETWAYLLGADNRGVPGCSSDLIARTAPAIIELTKPDVVYVLWPDWSRFEYFKDGNYFQSLPTDPNRMQFMETTTEAWLQDNFTKQVNILVEFCNNRAKLVHMTLYDLIPYIDHPDRWLISKLGHHYSPVWHTWIADIFRNKEND
jgi:hypothetical protein